MKENKEYKNKTIVCQNISPVWSPFSTKKSFNYQDDVEISDLFLRYRQEQK